jgi:hypothetical protein
VGGSAAGRGAGRGRGGRDRGPALASIEERAGALLAPLCRMVPFQATKPPAHQRTTDPLQVQSVSCAVLSPYRAIITWRDGERIENPKKAPVDQPTHTRRGTGNAPGLDRLQAHAVTTHAQYKSGTDRHPVLTNVPRVPAGDLPSRPSKPWPAFSQRRHISKRSTARLHHALAGRTGLRDGRAQNRGGRAWAGRVWHPAGLLWATTRQPRGGKL